MYLMEFNRYEPQHEKTKILYIRKLKRQISFAVTVTLISVFVFATWESTIPLLPHCSFSHVAAHRSSLFLQFLYHIYNISDTVYEISHKVN